MPDSRHVVILANPYSGKGKNKLRVEALEAALGKRGITTRQVWDLNERQTILSDPLVGDTYRCVVSAGGDGSMAGVVNDLRAGGDTTRAPIAMLPMGNENLFAKEFGHDRGIDALASAIDKLQTRTIDVGEVGGRLFTLMASVGFDSQVVERVDHWRRATNGNGLKRVSHLSYVPRILSVVAGYRYPLITLTADGRSYTGAHAFVFNIGQYGGGLRIGAHADAGDGLLDFVVFQKPGLINLARYGLVTLLRRHLQCKDVHHGRSKQITLSTDGEALPIQADGDRCGLTPTTIRVIPGAMRVVVAG